MATRTWSGTTSNDWNTTTNWVEGFIPTNADDVVFSTNVDCNVTSAAVCLTIDFGTYSGTFTNTGGLTVSGNVTLGSSVVWGTFSSNLTVNATATLTSNGKDIPRLGFNNTITITFADNWTVTSNLFFPNVSMTLTLNGNTLYVSGGNITHHNACTVNGTTTIEISGTVNYSNTGANYISNPIIINTAGTFSLSNAFNISNTTITWLAGTFDPGTSTTSTSGTITFTGTGLTFNNLTALNNTTLTLSNDITITGNLTGGGSTTTFVINGFNLYIGGGLATSVNTNVSGTTNFILNGTGTIGTASSSGFFQNNLEINTAGTITISGNFRYRTGSFVYTAGTVVTTGSNVIIQNTTTLDLDGVNFDRFTISGGTFTVTLLSNLTCISLTTGNIPTLNGFTIYLNSLSVNGNVGGTTDIEFNGSGTWTGVTSYLALNVNINCTSLVMTGAIGYRAKTLTYTAGTVDTTGSTVTIATTGATLNVNGNTQGTGSTISNSGINFFNLTITAATTLTTPICIIGTYSIGAVGVTGAIIYNQGSLITTNNTGGGELILNGSGTINCSAMVRFNLTVNTNGIYKFPINFTNNTKIFSFNSTTLTYLKGKLDTRDVTFLCQATSTLIGVHKLRFRRVVLSNQITMDDFFQGSASQICQVVSGIAGVAYTVVFTDGFQKISNYTSVQDMALTNTNASRGSLLLTYSKANRGRNVGNITYINDKPNGIIGYQDTVKSLETMAGVQLQGDPAYN